jgi:preprotein translocase subunit SecD
MSFPLWQRIVIWLVCAAGIIFAAPNLFYDRVEQSNDAEAAILAGQTGAELDAAAAGWPSYLPHDLVPLGLDLRGGAHLLAEVQVEEVYAARMEAFWPTVRDALAAERDAVGFVTREEGPDDQLTVRISDEAGATRALEIVQGLAQPVSSLTGLGETDIVATAAGPLITIELSEAEKAASDDRTVAQALEIIRRRIDEVGTREPTIMRQGADRILVQVPGVGSAQEVKDIIGTTAQLTFQPVVGRADGPDQVVGASEEVVRDLYNENLWYVLERTPVVTGEELVDAQPSTDQNGQPAVSFRFNPQGARAFGDYTAENIGAPFAIVLDNQVISAPTIRDHIPGGNGIISGSFTVEDATELSVLLRAGALPAGLVFLEERTVGPELGQDSIDAGRFAAVIAMIAVAAYMILSYGLFGVFSVLSLMLNIALIVGILSIVGLTLSLPGIAGIVLTIGMAVDANVLIFERIREELRAGRNPARAIEEGYGRALSAIVDANITTFITAVVLFAVGSGPVRGFAIVLGVGIITSVFTAVFVTRAIMAIWFNRARPRAITV